MLACEDLLEFQVLAGTVVSLTGDGTYLYWVEPALFTYLSIYI